MRSWDSRRTPLTSKRIDRFFEAICATADSHGFAYFLVGRFPDVLKRRMPDVLLITNWPEDLVARYDATDLFTESEVIRRVRYSALPVIADRLIHAAAPNGSELDGSVGISVGFSNSLAFCAYDAEKKPYFFIFSGPSPKIDDGLIGSVLLQSLRSLNDLVPDPRKSGMLSARETDCLGWVAAGKSSEEIATILELSAHTVNDYLQSAIRKLGATNRTQAVVAAIRMGLL